MELTEQLGAMLRALQISEVVYALSGGGDSGETTLESVTYRDDRLAQALPDVPILITDTGRVRHLAELLEEIVADAPEGDWVNNEGGHGTVYIRPFEDDGEGLALECDMIFREEGDDGDDEDDDEFVDEASGDDEGDDSAIGLAGTDTSRRAA